MSGNYRRMKIELKDGKRFRIGGTRSKIRNGILFVETVNNKVVTAFKSVPLEAIKKYEWENKDVK
jgi:hypothetical protein